MEVTPVAYDVQKVPPRLRRDFGRDLTGIPVRFAAMCSLCFFSNCRSDEGASSDEGKPGGVMVEFDDGDRGKISLHNIRLLPPGYQIHCGCPPFSSVTAFSWNLLPFS